MLILGCSDNRKTICQKKSVTFPDNNFVLQVDEQSKELTDFSLTKLKNDLKDGTFKIYDTTSFKGIVFYSYVSSTLPTTFKIIWDKIDCNQTQYIISNPLFVYEHYKDFNKVADLYSKPTGFNEIYNLSQTVVTKELQDVFNLMHTRREKLNKIDSITLFQCVVENYFQKVYGQMYLKITDKKSLINFLQDSNINKKQFSDTVLIKLNDLINSNMKSEFYAYYNLKTEALDLFIFPFGKTSNFQRFFLPPLMFYQEEPFI